MTILNLSHKYIFVHIPKTAGHSLKAVLEKSCSGGDILLYGNDGLSHPYREKTVKLNKHSFASEIIREIGADDFNSFYSFSFVRNPFSRATSIFKFLKYNFSWPGSAVMDKFPTLSDFVLSNFFQRPGPGRMFEPQSTWVASSKNELLVDYIGRVESFQENLAEICEKISVRPGFRRPKPANVSKFDAHGSDLALSVEAADAVRERYALDFTLFGYANDPDSPISG